MEGEKKIHKGGNHSRFEPSNLQEINASPYAKRSFENSACLRFCERIQEVGCHAQLTSLFSTSFKRNKVFIASIQFTISAEVIASATGIPNHGEI